MADLTPVEFSVAVLRRLGAPVTPQNVSAMVGWVSAEGGHYHNDAHYNPLNTTKKPATGTYGNTGKQGDIKQYTSWQQGIDATVSTLQQSNFAGIRSALQRGNSATAVDSAIIASPWGTTSVSPGATLSPATVKHVNSTLSHLVLGALGPVGLAADTVDPNIGATLDSGAEAVGAAVDPIPAFLSKLGVIFQGGFWLRAGKILLGIIALALGAVLLGETFMGGSTVKAAKAVLA